MLGWSSERLGIRSDTSADVIKVYELTGRRVTPPPLRVDPVPGIRAALQAAGVQFTIGGEPGVKLRKAEG